MARGGKFIEGFGGWLSVSSGLDWRCCTAVVRSRMSGSGLCRSWAYSRSIMQERPRQADTKAYSAIWPRYRRFLLLTVVLRY